VWRNLALVLAALAVALAVFTAFSAVMRVQRLSLPAVTGQFAVGRTEIAVTDTDRIDPFAGDGRMRELAVWIWYPTVDDLQGSRAAYLPDAWAPLVNNLGPFSQDLSKVATNSVADAPLSGTPPVAVLMPGLGEPIASYSVLAEDLASHGYAVVGINPTGSMDVVFPDGHLVPATAEGSMAGSWSPEAAGDVATVWAADAEFVVRTLSSTAPEIGALDFSRVAYVGHSLGGAASFEACRTDRNCVAAVDLDGTLFTEVRNAGLAAPSLLVQAVRPEGCDLACESFEVVEAAPQARQFEVAGSAHMSFADYGLFWSPIDSLGLGSIDAERMTAITRDLVRSFLAVHVRNAPPRTFDDAVARYAELEEID
jgi:pimeloyl-ACP methyl ester carboxylesterase